MVSVETLIMPSSCALASAPTLRTITDPGAIFGKRTTTQQAIAAVPRKSADVKAMFTLAACACKRSLAPAEPAESAVPPVGTVPREQEIDEQSEQWETIREREARWQRAVDLAVAAGLEREVAEQAVTAAVAELGPQAFQPLAARD